MHAMLEEPEGKIILVVVDAMAKLPGYENLEVGSIERQSPTALRVEIRNSIKQGKFPIIVLQTDLHDLTKEELVEQFCRSVDEQK